MNNAYKLSLKNKFELKRNTNRGIILFGLVVFYILAFINCSGSDDSTIPVEVDNVLLVYLGGDNNLSDESFTKLDAISRGYNGAKSYRVLIYQDSRNEPACLYEADGNGSYKAIETYGIENSADPAVFSRVLAKAKKMYPNASFNLLVFSHASGWLPAGSLENSSLRSVIIDGKNQMEFRDFAAAIPDGMFDLIAFDACYMAGIEVAYELRKKTQYILASSAEIVSPGFTPVYEQYTMDLITGNYKQFAIQAFAYFDNRIGYMRSGTLSIIKTQGLEELFSFVKDECDFTRQIDLVDIQYFDRGRGYLFCDFLQYYSLLLSTDQQKEQLQNLVDNCVVWKAATPSFLPGFNGFDITVHSGLTSYIPQKGYPKLNDAYKKLAWCPQDLTYVN